MAKRRMVRKEEEKEVKMPEFDEKSFLLEETQASRILYITLTVSITSGILTGLISQATWPRGIYGVLFGLAVAALLPKTLKFFKIVLEEVPKKRWAEAFGVYFITWFVVWIYLLNPPFFDVVSPKITTGIFLMNVAPYPEIAPVEGEYNFILNAEKNYTILCRAADNWHIDSLNIILDNNTKLNSTILTKNDLSLFNQTLYRDKWMRYGGDYYRVDINLYTGQHKILIKAVDPKGNIGKVSLNVKVI